MHAIGPYEFTDQDVATTLTAGAALLDLVTAGLATDAVGAATPFLARAEQALREASTLGGTTKDTAALDRFWPEWRGAMAAIRSTGTLGPPAIGSVGGLFLSDGDVPKQQVESVEVDFGGVIGDRQGDRADHGRPFQALCLWCTESIDQLQAEGHPIAPGLAGENLSITGLAWPRVRPGVHLRIGDVLAEVTSYAVPCRKNAPWFADGRFDVIHHHRGPHSRVYATVLEPGSIMTGAPVLLEPDGIGPEPPAA